jgi:ribosomal protein L11 methyltransferase
VFIKINKKLNWIEIKIKSNSVQLEILSAFLFALGSCGVYEGEDNLIVYFKKEEWNNEKYILLLDYLKNIFTNFQDSDLEISEIPDQDWNESWKENFKTFHVTENLVISPDWEKYKLQGAEKVIVISPKMAFGTGHHETTQLVLIMMEKYVKNKMSLLDVGSGSGILAIYAAQLGAEPIRAFDNDPIAIENLVENIILNKVSDRINYFTGGLKDSDKQKYDIILANINRNVLLESASQFSDYINPAGKLILSGLLINDEDTIIKAYRIEKWNVIEKMQRGEWLALVLEWKG